MPSIFPADSESICDREEGFVRNSLSLFFEPVEMRRAADACMNIGAHGTVTFMTKNVDLALYCKAFFLDVACCLDLHVVRCFFVVFSASPSRHFWFQPRATPIEPCVCIVEASILLRRTASP